VILAAKKYYKVIDMLYVVSYRIYNKLEVKEEEEKKNKVLVYIQLSAHRNTESNKIG
jgi:hypothetical protein